MVFDVPNDVASVLLAFDFGSNHCLFGAIVFIMLKMRLSNSLGSVFHPPRTPASPFSVSQVAIAHCLILLSAGLRLKPLVGIYLFLSLPFRVFLPVWPRYRGTTLSNPDPQPNR